MADLLLQTHSAPAIRIKPATRSNLRSPKSPKIPKATQPSGIVGAFSHTLQGVNNIWQSWKDGLTVEEREELAAVEEKRLALFSRMKNAETRAEWEEAARELDKVEGNDAWKKDSTTGDYNSGLIRERLKALNEARANYDIRSMMHLLRTALSRDLGGMDNVDLYRHSYVGTKELIERYVESTLETIEAVVTQSRLDPGIEYKDLLEGMLFARQSFGRSALLLSGGGTFGMSHIGVLKALFDAQLLPRIISGASAGSIVCAVLCTRTDEEIPDMMNEFPYGDLAVFEEAGGDGMLDHLRRLLTEGSWSDIKHLTRVMRALTGDMTFQEAYNRTRRILNICVSTASIYELPRLLNYVTAPNVMIWSAVAASCSVPLVFNASPLLVKDPVTGEHLPWNPSPQRWIDGSVDNDLPMTRLSEMFNVNHFIVSQVNPHVVPFLAKDDHLVPGSTLERDHANQQEGSDWLYTLTTLAKDEAMHRLQFLAEIGILPNLATKLRSILSQRYSGDINILPEMSMHDLPGLLRNPTSEFMIRVCLAGERATWPKLGRVRNRCAIELALDRAVHRLRTRVVFSESQRDLRRLHTSAVNIHPKLPGTGIPSTTITGPVGDKHPRRRRQSGGSVLMRPTKPALLDSAITDEETEQEERIELRARRSQGTSPVSLRKPRLHRASRSHIHVRTCAISPSRPPPTPLFDFSKPMTPQSRNTVGPDFADLADCDSGLLTPEPWLDLKRPSRRNVASPTDDVVMSETDDANDVFVDDLRGRSEGDIYRKP